MHVPMRALVVLAMLASFAQFINEPSFADPPVLEAPCQDLDPGTDLPEGETVPDYYDYAPDVDSDTDGDGEPDDADGEIDANDDPTCGDQAELENSGGGRLPHADHAWQAVPLE